MLKYLVICALVFGAYCAGSSYAGTIQYNPCHQETYDMVYQHIVQQTLDSRLTARDFKARNDAIETLRTLCRGQKSSYE
jgi:hypothetical protein